MPEQKKLPPLRKLVADRAAAKAAPKRGGPGAGAPPAPPATKKLPPSPPPAAGQQGPGDDGAAFSFDELSAEEMTALQDAADAAEQAGLLPEDGGPDSSQRPDALPKPGDGDDGGHGEEPLAGGPGDDGAAPADDAEGEGEPEPPSGPDTLYTLAQSAAQEAQTYSDQIEKLVDVAEQMRAGKPKQVQALLKKAGPLVKQAQDAAEEAEKAYGGGDEPDTKALAVAYAEADEACRAVEDLLEQAKVASGKEPPPEEGEEDGPEGGGDGEEADEKERAPKGRGGPKGASPARSRWAAYAAR